MCYSFLFVKLTYMLETVVFMLGKKYTLVSKYHVTHHSTLPLFVWLGVNYFPGGHATFFVLANSFTHIFLFGYFVIVTASPGLKKYTTWWKSAFNWLHVSDERNRSLLHFYYFHFNRSVNSASSSCTELSCSSGTLATFPI